jgi:hypothetical protein
VRKADLGYDLKDLNLQRDVYTGTSLRQHCGRRTRGNAVSTESEGIVIIYR